MPIPASQLAQWCSGRLEGPATREFSGLETMERADESHMTFVGHAAYARKFAECKAGGAVCNEDIPVQHRPDQIIIWVKNADLAVAQILEKLAPAPPYPPIGIHPTAVIDPSATLGENVCIGAHAVVQAGAKIGARTVLMPNVFVGAESAIGEDCVLWPNVALRERCTIGDRCILHCGCVVGADGFGYRFDRGRHVKIPQIGTVIIHDDCELGANTTVDRGKFSATVIGQGSKLDNLVQVGHNTHLGKHSILIAHVAVGGSVQAGDYLVVGGASVISDHLTLGNAVQVAGLSSVTKDVESGGQRIGSPALSAAEFKADWRAPPPPTPTPRHRHQTLTTDRQT